MSCTRTFIRPKRSPASLGCGRARVLVAGAALSLAGLTLPGVLPVREAGAPAAASGGLIAFRDANGIGVIDPVTGRERMLLSVPAGCASSSRGVPQVELAGPAWAPSSGPGARLYFWLSDYGSQPTAACQLPPTPQWMRGSGPILVEADPATGALKAVAAAPGGLPCEPGTDLVAVPGALAFTNGGCDEPQVQGLTLPLLPGAQPVTAGLAIAAAKFAPRCAIDEELLGTGPDGKVLFQEAGTQCAPPPPSLQWWSPVGRSVGLFLPRPPRALWDNLRASAAASSSQLVAFAAGRSGAGLLSLGTGKWSAESLPRCAGVGCTGATSVSFSSNGRTLAVAADGTLVVAPVSTGVRPRVMLRGARVSDVSWSGPVDEWPGPGGAGPGLVRLLPSLWAPFSKFWGEGESHTWRVDPAAAAQPVVSAVSPPGHASAPADGVQPPPRPANFSSATRNSGSSCTMLA